MGRTLPPHRLWNYAQSVIQVKAAAAVCAHSPGLAWRHVQVNLQAHRSFFRPINHHHLTIETNKIASVESRLLRLKIEHTLCPKARGSKRCCRSVTAQFVFTVVLGMGVDSLPQQSWR